MNIKEKKEKEITCLGYVRYVIGQLYLVISIAYIIEIKTTETKKTHIKYFLKIMFCMDYVYVAGKNQLLMEQQCVRNICSNAALTQRVQIKQIGNMPLNIDYVVGAALPLMMRKDALA